MQERRSLSVEQAKEWENALGNTGKRSGQKFPTGIKMLFEQQNVSNFISASSMATRK